MKFIAIIWPTAAHLIDAIIREIETYQYIDVITVLHTELSNHFGPFVYDLYDEGDLDEYGYLVENKINLILKRTERRDIYSLELELPGSDLADRVKKLLRSKFRNDVRDYEYDVIIHCSDDEDEYIRAKNTISKYRKM